MRVSHFHKKIVLLQTHFGPQFAATDYFNELVPAGVCDYKKLNE